MGIEPIFEVFRHADYTRAGLVQGLLEANGIRTMMRNRNAVSCTTEIPIPVMYPNICVFSREDMERAKTLIEDYDRQGPVTGETWLCGHCGETNESPYSECWSCQAPTPAPDLPDRE